MAYKSIEMLRLYRSFTQAKYRCTQPTNPDWINYGGRGIQFKFNSFSEWKKVLGDKPIGDYSVDRIDNTGHYELNNIHWATRKQQAKNKRMYKSNTTGVKGVSQKNDIFLSQYNQVILYRGKDFFEACCSRKSAEHRMP